MLSNAWLANVGRAENNLNDLHSTDDAVRYWVGVGLLYQLAKTAGSDGTKPTAATKQLLEKLRPAIEKLAGDEQRIVRIPAAEALGRYGTEADVATAEKILIGMIGDTASPSYSYYRTLMALNALDYFRARITDPGFPARVKAATDSMPKPPERASQTFDKIIKSILP
jgi:HEAT repeat protein